jgi:CHASE2 domain-containing sensor protein
MGYGDLFIAGALGGLLAVYATRERQLAASLLVAALALSFDLLFFVAEELPATVPVALALLLLSAWWRAVDTPAQWRRREQQRVTAQGAGG